MIRLLIVVLVLVLGSRGFSMLQNHRDMRAVGTCVWALPSGFIVNSWRVLLMMRTNTIFVPSGEKSGLWPTAPVVRRVGLLPSRSTVQLTVPTATAFKR